jgi:hypothetical protein
MEKEVCDGLMTAFHIKNCLIHKSAIRSTRFTNHLILGCKQYRIIKFPEVYRWERNISYINDVVQ